MKFIIQRVQYAKVTVKGKETGSINQGFLVFIGIGQNDTKETADKMIKKTLNLRIFEDSDGKTNLSLKDVDGGILLVSQFTLYANCKKGNRPSFIEAGKPDESEKLYDYIVNQVQKSVSDTKKGVFGADMKVSLLNDGPFTIILDSELL